MADNEIQVEVAILDDVIADLARKVKAGDAEAKKDLVAMLRQKRKMKTQKYIKECVWDG